MSFFVDIDSASTDRAGPRSTLSDTNRVVETPTVLSSAAGIDIDIYSGARMLASEEGSGSGNTLVVLAECVRNKASRSGESITALLTAPTGDYGEQLGHWASTRLDPQMRHVAAMADALRSGSNFALGAIDFFDPSSSYSGATQLGAPVQGGEAYIRARAGEGLQWVGEIDGVDPEHVMLFAPVDGATPDDALARIGIGPIYDATDDGTMFGPLLPDIGGAISSDGNGAVVFFGMIVFISFLGLAVSE